MDGMDLTRTLPENLEGMIAGGGMIALSVIIVMIIVIMKRWKGRIIPLLLGLVAYLIIVFMIPNLLISALALIPNISVAFEYNPTAYIIIYSALVAVASLAAKYMLSAMLLERYERKGDIYMAGIGLGLGDVALYAMTAISSYVWCLAIYNEGLEAAFAGMTEAEIASTYESIELLYSAPVIIWILFGLNAVMDMLVQFALTNVVYGAVKHQLNSNVYVITTVITFLSIISFQLYDEASIISIIICFAVKLLVCAAAMYYTFRIAAKSIEYVED